MSSPRQVQPHDIVYRSTRASGPERASPSGDHPLVALGKNWNCRRSRLSIESKMSAIAAGEMFTRGETGAIIFSGGRTAGPHRPSEAHAMYAYMRCHFTPEQVPDSAITLEGEAIDTAANADKIAAILRREGRKDVCLLTTRYHLPAAQTLFRHYGVGVAGAIPSEDVLLGRSKHYVTFLERWGRSNRTRVARAEEVMRRLLLRFDRKGRALRPVTTVLRSGWR